MRRFTMPAILLAGCFSMSPTAPAQAEDRVCAGITVTVVGQSVSSPASCLPQQVYPLICHDEGADLTPVVVVGVFTCLPVWPV